MAWATGAWRERLARWSRIQASSSATRGALALLAGCAPLIGTHAVDLALDVEQRVDTPDGLQRDR
ncbi:hypothetical protein GGQ86_004838 [Xanthobacter flavus]|uniref:Uncharacterized protein n=1 Tax=Xanthobacter flavus TaxID=281 RepID=A0ABU1KP09_XANFL|nr:hypothetical protein [Xanthobacter flavus]